MVTKILIQHDRVQQHYCQAVIKRMFIIIIAYILTCCFCPVFAADATWQCGRSPLGWVGRPDLSKCVSPSVVRLHSTVRLRLITRISCMCSIASNSLLVLMKYKLCTIMKIEFVPLWNGY